MLNAIRQLSPFDTLNADEGLLLDALIVKWHERDDIMVSEVMSDARFGSQPTAYRRIISLRDKGLVCLRTDSKDKRVKFVEPTQLARDYMASIREGITTLERPPQTV
jgi:DNA-binding MarR family transcriptional regulator